MFRGGAPYLWGDQFSFTGDIESMAEREILQRERDLGTTILKVAHHGSKSSTDPLSGSGQPAAAVICYGENHYGLPNQETLDNLADAGAVIYTTDQNGTIIFITDGYTYTVQKERS